MSELKRGRPCQYRESPNHAVDGLGITASHPSAWFTLVNRSGSMEKVENLAQWKESDLFDEKEKVVLDYTEAVTYSDQQVTDDLIERLKGL